jgi:hypothetical protein
MTGWSGWCHVQEADGIEVVDKVNKIRAIHEQEHVSHRNSSQVTIDLSDRCLMIFKIYGIIS